jgi:hypothetical protein
VRNSHGEQQVPPALQKVFQFVPTPAPEPPPPPVKPRTSALAVFALLTSIFALLFSLGSMITILVEVSGVRLSRGDFEAIRVVAFSTAPPRSSWPSRASSWG